MLATAKTTETVIFGTAFLLRREEPAGDEVRGVWPIHVWVMVNGARGHLDHGTLFEQVLVEVGVLCDLTDKSSNMEIAKHFLVGRKQEGAGFLEVENVEGLGCDAVLDGCLCTSVNLSAEVILEARSQIGHENHPKRSWAGVKNDGEGHAGLESCNLRFWDLVADADVVTATRDLGGRLEATLFVVGANCGGDLFTTSYGCFGDDGWEYTDRESNQAAFEVPAHSRQYGVDIKEDEMAPTRKHRRLLPFRRGSWAHT